MKYDAIIFDFDGTLFQTEKLAIPAFDRTFAQLEEAGYTINKRPSERQLLSLIGMTSEDIWKELLPDLPLEAHLNAKELMLQNELDGVKESYGVLYPGVIETLLELSNKGYKLFIASNGLKEYIKGIASAFRIEHYFDGIYTAGEYNTKSKKDLVKQLLKDFSIERAIMVGDRISDVEAGLSNQLFTIGCDFGFASIDELKGANVIVQKFTQVSEVIDQL